MTTGRPYSRPLDQLRSVGLRPTRQRLALAKLLFNGNNRHVTAEMLHTEARNAQVQVSLATIYNTLHQFTVVGLLHEIVVDSGYSYFDTNTTTHHHFYCEDSSELMDIDGSEIEIGHLPKAPTGMEVTGVEVIVRIKSS